MNLNPLSLVPPQYKLAAIAIAAVALVLATATATYKVEEWRWTAAIAEQKDQAHKTMLEEVAKGRKAERDAAVLNNETEKKHAQDLTKRNDELALALKYAATTKLRDPGHRSSSGCPSSSASAGPNSSDSGTGGTELSAESTSFLLTEFNKCDKVVDQYLGAQTYAVKLWEICQHLNK